MMQVDAIILAGGIPQPGELIYTYTQGKPKALLEMAGRSMLAWVVAALDGSAAVRRVAVSGLDASTAPVPCLKPLVYAPDRGSIMGNAQAGVLELATTAPVTRHVLIVSSDIPALTSEAVDWVAATAAETDYDVHYSLIPRDKMETRFPGSKRSYFYFKDGVFTGGDVNVISSDLLMRGHAKAPALIEARKNIFKQAQLIGWDVLLGFALRRLTVAEAARAASQRLTLNGRAIICPYAEVGMDVDKPAQFELVRHDLETRVERAAA